jgi:hypothetical protein
VRAGDQADGGGGKAGEASGPGRRSYAEVAAGGSDEAAGTDKAGGERAGQEGGAERDDGGGGGVLGMAGEAARRVHDTAEHLAEKVRPRAAGSQPGGHRCSCGPWVRGAQPAPVQSPASRLHGPSMRWQLTGGRSVP